MKNQKDNEMASVGMIKEAFRRDSEAEGFVARSVCFGIGAVLFPFELAKVGLEKLGVEFDSGEGRDTSPYDL